MTSTIDINKYATIVFWSDEDQAYIAKVPNIETFKYLSAFGDTKEEALKELNVALSLAIDVLIEDGRPVPEPKRIEIDEVVVI